ncbi:MAG: hypothetical protein EOO30_16325 [Comamonadaceae bacterium]|nr:MAG: hypothetical protein EOO30_16325 [Comamonadaceae bacterium]
MPYFLYRVQPFAQLQPLGEYASFPEASREAKAVRAAAPAQERRRVRVIFADNALAAEDLLLQVREPQPGGDDD